MKPLKLSTKLNLLGEDMKHSKAFENLKKHDHSASFDGLGEWLDKNHKKPNTMKNIYKIAASFIFATLILIACTVPVEQEEEIGYMIKGIAGPDAISLKTKLAEIPDLDPSLISVREVIHEQIKNEKVEELTEVIMVLAESNYSEAIEMSDKLRGVFEFTSLDILPIEEKVERTMYQSVLRTFDIKVADGITEEKLVARINSFVHEHSSEMSEAQIKEDKDGNRYVAFSLNAGKEGTLEIKRSVETLHNDLAPQIKIKNLDPDKQEQLKEKELEKLKELREKAPNQ